jgi:hypothetical protein
VSFIPLDAPLCPICGNPNGCAVAAAGTFAADCWCKGMSFSETTLARVPDALRGKACICRRCAEGAGGRADAGLVER